MKSKKFSGIGALVIMILFFGCVSINARASEAFGDDYVPSSAILVSVTDLGDECVLYEYLDVSDSHMSTYSENGRGAKKYYYYKIAGEIVITIEGNASFTYGHTDGNARATAASYRVLRVDERWGVSVGPITTALSNGNPASATFYITIYQYDGSVLNTSMTVYCNNNGNVY